MPFNNSSCNFYENDGNEGLTFSSKFKEYDKSG